MRLSCKKAAQCAAFDGESEENAGGDGLDDEGQCDPKSADAGNAGGSRPSKGKGTRTRRKSLCPCGPELAPLHPFENGALGWCPP